MPIPDEPERIEIEELVTDLITALDELAASRTPRARTLKQREVTMLRRDIEGTVSALFGLSEADIETVRAVPVPT